MRIARHLAIAITAALSLFVLVPAAASATPDYAQQVATALQANPVYVDKAAQPTITPDQAAQLTSAIHHSGKPLYLVLIDNAQTQNYKTPSDFLKAVGLALGKDRSAIIAVSSSKRFYADAFNVSPPAGSDAESTAQDVAKRYQGDPFQECRAWIDILSTPPSADSQPNQATTAQAAPSTQDNGLPTWAWVLIVVGCLVVGILLLVLVEVAVRRRRERKLHARRKRTLERTAEDLEDDLVAMEPQLVFHPGAKGLNAAAHKSLKLGRNALADNDLDDAKQHLHSAAIKRDQALDIIEGRADLPENHEERASGGALKVQDRNGKTRVINQQTVVVNQTQQPGFGNYWEGGYYSGLYWAPGWYADPFWDWMLLDTMLAYDDSWAQYDQGYDQGFDQGFDAGEQQNDSNDTRNGDNSAQSDQSNDSAQTPDNGNDTSNDSWDNAGDDQGNSDQSSQDNWGDSGSDGTSSADSGDAGTDSWSDSSSDSGYDGGGSDFGGSDDWSS